MTSLVGAVTGAKSISLTTPISDVGWGSELKQA